ncbi:MAG TPA: M20/M25/M40 family metallo-hydrolase [Pyrinomonadaceae bacterium]|nr:M20/M25/M40 family metallo-hydrolase [Pyrinomonadaceae bacterium]
MFRKFFNISLIITLAFSVVLAQSTTTTKSTPSVERLREHVTYLASDKLAGRRTGTSGADEAAQYVAEQFAELGLRPGNQPARSGKLRAADWRQYLQPFPYVAGVELAKDNLLSSTLTASNLRTGEDWMPLGLSSNGKVNAPAVFVGYGINAPEWNHNDYAGIDTAKKIAVALSGTPDGDNPHSKFARYEDVRWKAIAAKNAGAKALIVIARAENFKEDRLSRLSYDNAGDAGIPVAVVSRQEVVRLISGTPISDLEFAAREKTHSSINKTLVKVSLGILLTRREVPAANVIGILDGSDPVLKNEAIVIGAHYDHLGRGGAGSLAPKEGDVHHGADDNASGTAGVLEMARLLTAEKPRRTIVFIAFSGEEEGLLGSNYYVNHPVVPIENTIAMINMDMIGRMKNNRLTIGGIGTAEQWRQMVANANSPQRMKVTARGEAPAGDTTVASGSRPVNMNMPIVVGANGRTIVTLDNVPTIDLTLNEDGFGPSDHSSFYAKKVPVLFLWTGTHEDYHKPSDTAEKIEYHDEARILTLVLRLIHEIDDADKRPTYTLAKTESTGRATGFRVYLGTIPNYADSNDGLLLDGVREDSPAAKAGLKAGDKIVKLAGREIRNVYDYTYALGEMKAGQDYEVEVMRASERLKLKLTPAEKR